MSNGFLKVPQEVKLHTLLINKEKAKDCKAQKLKAGHYYAFQITSFNACGETVNDIQWFQTQASTPNPPDSPVATTINCDSIELSWRDLTEEECNGSDLHNYYLQVDCQISLHFSYTFPPLFIHFPSTFHKFINS